VFERPALLWLLVAIPVVAMPGAIACARGRVAAGAAAAALRALAFAVLVFALAGLGISALVPAHHLEVVALVDQSHSIAPDQADWMAAAVERVGGAMAAGSRLAVMGFGRDVRLLSPFSDPRLAAVRGPSANGGATDIAGALAAAQGLFAPGAEKRILLLSDGNQTAGDAKEEIPSLAGEGIRVYAAAPPPSKTERVAVVAFTAPEGVRAGERFEFALEIESEAPKPVGVSAELSLDGTPAGSQAVTLSPGLNRFTLPYRIARPGAYLIEAKVKAPAPLVVVNSQSDTALTVTEPPRILVVTESPPESLMSALKVRKYDVEIASPRGLPEQASSYLPYQLVILADTGASALSPASLKALSRYVADFGGGLVATGATLRDDRFAGTALERMLPVKFRPQPPPPEREPIAVYLLIDRSNSMSYDSRFPAVRDGQRIRYAKAAAIALLRQLDDTDYAGVIAFDSQPYVLSHLAPLGPNRAALEDRIERLEPGGGTDFKQALEIAEREILASGIAVRQVFLLTDGDTNRQYHDHDALIASYAFEHIPVSTIRIGPDLANLRLLKDFAQATGGTFYRVQDIKKLPLLLVGLTREAMNRPRRQRAIIQAGAASGILTGFDLRKVPPIYYVAVTAPKEGAQIPLLMRRGSQSMPLLAAWQYGLGRTAAFTADPDSAATMSWIRWDRYAEFWSQLVTWAMRLGDSGMFTMRIQEAADGALRVEAEKADANPAANLFVRITGPGRATDVAMTQVGVSRYRSDIGRLPRGKYTATLMVKSGDTERVLESRPFASTASAPADAEELKIRPPNIGLLRRLAAGTGGAVDAPASTIATPAGATVTVRRSAAGYLLPLALVLLLGEVFIRRRFLGD
jgi:Ca-activated chloride channel homolog